MVDVISIACMWCGHVCAMDYSDYITRPAADISRRIQYVPDSHVPNKPNNPSVQYLQKLVNFYI